MEIEDAVQQFREAAIAKGAFAEPAAKDHAFHEEMSIAWRRLNASGPVGQNAFKALLTDDSRHVRAWVAAQLLALGDESGLPVLEADATIDDLAGFSSREVLTEWRAGRFGPPLGNAGA